MAFYVTEDHLQYHFINPNVSKRYCIWRHGNMMDLFLYYCLDLTLVPLSAKASSPLYNMGVIPQEDTDWDTLT